MSSPPELPAWQSLDAPLSEGESTRLTADRPYVTSSIYDGCTARDDCRCRQCVPCDESIFNQCAETDDCVCPFCKPAFVAPASADNCQTLRVLFLNIVHSGAIFMRQLAQYDGPDTLEAEMLCLQIHELKRHQGLPNLNDQLTAREPTSFFGDQLRIVLLEQTKDERTRAFLDIEGPNICLPVEGFLIPAKGKRVVFTIQTDQIVNGYYSIQASINVKDGEGNILGQMGIKNEVELNVTKDFESFRGTCHYSAKGEFRLHEPLHFKVQFNFVPSPSPCGKSIQDLDNFEAIINLLRVITDLSFDRQGNERSPHVDIQHRIQKFEKLGIKIISVGRHLINFGKLLYPSLDVNVWETHSDPVENTRLREQALDRQRGYTTERKVRFAEVFMADADRPIKQAIGAKRGTTRKPAEKGKAAKPRKLRKPRAPRKKKAVEKAAEAEVGAGAEESDSEAEPSVKRLDALVIEEEPEDDDEALIMMSGAL